MQQSTTAKLVKDQLHEDFPAKSIAWAGNSDVKWSKKTTIPVNKIDFSSADQWSASKHTAKLAKFRDKIKAGKKKPVILARIPGKNNGLVVLDGHHRVLAHRQLGIPPVAYVADIGAKSAEAALDMHASQRSGDSGTPMKDRVMKFTAETPAASTVPHPVGKYGLWHVKGLQLPPYIQNVAKALRRNGKTESESFHMSVGIVEGWAEGRGPKGKKITPQVQAAAAKAVAEWNAKRAKAHLDNTVAHKETLNMADLRKIEEMDIPHKHPAPVRKVVQQLIKSGQAKNHADALAQAQKLFKQWAAGKNSAGAPVAPVVQEGAQKALGKWNRKKPKVAREDFDVKQLANDHHDELGRFTHRPPVPACIEVLSPQEETVRDFQRQHGLPETGKLDAATDKLYREAF